VEDAVEHVDGEPAARERVPVIMRWHDGSPIAVVHTEGHEVVVDEWLNGWCGMERIPSVEFVRWRELGEPITLSDR
jgi:hypothetical protein